MIGHPDLATAEKGKQFLEGIVGDVTAFVEQFLRGRNRAAAVGRGTDQSVAQPQPTIADRS